MRMKTAGIARCGILAFAVSWLLATHAVAAEDIALPAPPDLTKEIDFERTGQYYLGQTGAKGWIYVGSRLVANNNRAAWRDCLMVLKS